MSPARRAGLVVVLLVTCSLAAFVGRERALGAAAVVACDEALARGDLAGAIDAARGAAEARAPGSPYPERGYSRLVAIAEAAETRDNDATAASAWRAVRAAALATGTLGGASSHLAVANEGLARAAHPTRTGVAPRPFDREAFHDVMLSTLARDDTPSPWSFVLLGAGGLAFFAGALLALRLPAGATLRQVAVRASIAAVGLGLAVLALLRN